MSAFTLRASLRRGGSPNAWQHAQLFRQEWDTFDEPTFEICIHLKPEMVGAYLCSQIIGQNTSRPSPLNNILY